MHFILILYHFIWSLLNPMDREAWWGHKELDMTELLHWLTYFYFHKISKRIIVGWILLPIIMYIVQPLEPVNTVYTVQDWMAHYFENIFCRYNWAKDLEIRESSWVTEAGHKFNDLYSFKRKVERDLKSTEEKIQKRSCDDRGQVLS